MHLSLPEQFPLLFILASSVCKSLQYLISALTQEGEGSHLFGCTCSVVLWRGRDTANKCHWCVGEGAHSVCTTLGLPQSKVACASQVYTIQAPGFSARTLSQVSLAFCALPRSKLLRFSGTLQRTQTQLGYAFCVFPRSK